MKRWIFGTLLIVSACVSPNPTQATKIATIIFHNGNILTLETGQPTVQAIAIRTDKILATGKIRIF